MKGYSRYVLLLIVCLLAAPAYAEDAVQPALAAAMPPPPMPEMHVTYAPEGCEFPVSFPADPIVTTECDKDNPDHCYQQASFTQVYDLSATVSFRVICSPAESGLYKTYTADIMQKTLQAMTDGAVIKTFDTNFHEDTGYKMANLVGEGKMGVTPTLYVAQLWIGEHSSLSVEGNLIGNNVPDADALFGGIMRSISFAGKAQSAAPADQKTTEPTPPPAERAE